MLHRPKTAAALLALLVTPLAAFGPVASPAAAEVPAAVVVPETVTATLASLPDPGFAAASIEVGPPVPGEVVSAPVRTPIPFAMVGLDLPDGAHARFRTSDDGSRWSGWQHAEVLEAEEGPDLGSPEAARRPAGATEPVWTGAASWLQVAVEGAVPAEVGATLIDTLGLGGGTVSAAALPDEDGVDETPTGPDGGGTTIPGTPMPGAVSRAGWGADEALRAGSPSYASAVRYAVVHHTAGTNSYTEAEAPAVVRGILAYHTKTLGWSDIGYNALVDRFGNVYEGRAGGMERAVVGAHAQGFNTGSFGVSVLGEFGVVAPPQVAQDAVAQVIAWKLKRDRVDPAGGVLITSGGSNRYPAGQQVPMSTIFGHRDAGQTSCPGTKLYDRLPWLRTAVAARMATMPAPTTPVVTAPPPAPVAPPTTIPPPTIPKPAPAPLPAVPSFSDIAGSVHAAGIEALVRAGVTGGCGAGRFCPDAFVTRAQAVSLLSRAAGLPGATGQRFADVPPGHTHAAAVAAAVDAGWIGGYADGTFRPEALLNREQLATVLGRAAGLARTPGKFFTDVPWTSPHLAWVNAIGAAGISDGCGGGRYCPLATPTRAQLASLVAAAFP